MVDMIDLRLVLTPECRKLAEDIYGGQPEAIRVRILHQPQVCRLLLPLLQSRRTCEAPQLAG